MATPARVTPQEIYPRVKAGHALLVCAYPDEANCRSMQLEGAVSLRELQLRLPGLAKDQEIVFFCA
jgi:hypothetical protein